MTHQRRREMHGWQYYQRRNRELRIGRDVRDQIDNLEERVFRREMILMNKIV
jgi:hypothetical protein